jgi:hypothetical protein
VGPPIIKESSMVYLNLSQVKNSEFASVEKSFICLKIQTKTIIKPIRTSNKSTNNRDI